MNNKIENLEKRIELLEKIVKEQQIIIKELSEKINDQNKTMFNYVEPQIKRHK